MFGSWVLNEIWIIDLSSALAVMFMSPSKLFLCSKEVHSNSGVRLLLELYCVGVIKHVEINSDIHMYQFTFEPFLFYFRMWLWIRI